MKRVDVAAGALSVQSSHGAPAAESTQCSDLTWPWRAVARGADTERPVPRFYFARSSTSGCVTFNYGNPAFDEVLATLTLVLEVQGLVPAPRFQLGHRSLCFNNRQEF